MPQPIIQEQPRHRIKDIHEMICLNMDKYKINRGDYQVDLQKIKLVVLKYFGVGEHDFISDRKNAEFVLARRFYCGLAKSLTKFSMRTIGEGIGGRDHSTVIYSVNKLSDDFFLNPKLKDVYENMKADVLDKPIPYPDNYTYDQPKSEKLTAKQIERIREKSFEMEEVEVSHSQNNNGYSHNHDKIYD